MSVMPSREKLVRAVSDELHVAGMSECRRIVDVVFRELGGCLEKIVAGEPYFVLRAHDVAAPLTVLNWVERADDAGAPAAKQQEAIRCATEMEKWQQTHGSKIPD